MAGSRKISVPGLIFASLLSLAAGSVGALLAGGNFGLYGMLNLPPLSPPPAVFGIVWTVLYLLMGAASYFIHNSGSADSGGALGLYVLYLVTNILWPAAFFGKGAFLLSFFLICAQILLILACFSAYRKISALAAWLIFPTIIWSFFALYLNGGVLFLN
ncbi:MAG: tryptophan-rich sensory protein [Clostridia bacterium]|nr:tryptophan-rich sensory protein [Clostridia bacterium]